MADEVSPDVRSADSQSAQVELSRFDMTVEGLVTSAEGTVDHEVTFNAYDVFEASYAIRGEDADEADLVHDAQQFMHDQRRLKAVMVVGKRPPRHLKGRLSHILDHGLRKR